MVLEYVRPFVSSKDIGPGQRWGLELAAELESTRFGIICVTRRESDESSWVSFEAGALSGSVAGAGVAPYLNTVQLVGRTSGPRGAASPAWAGQRPAAVQRTAPLLLK